jgi:hypothetical protein
MRIRLLLAAALLALSGCVEDYDVAEVAPGEHLDQEHHHEEGDYCEECHDDHDHAHADEEEVLHSGDATPSGHSHGAGVRNHGTQWFFNQPWAARFIWGKLARDGAIFLLLAGIIFFLSGRRRRR